MNQSMPLQPDPDPGQETLLQREGVNAGSDRSTDESPATVADVEMSDALGSVRAVEGSGTTPDPRSSGSGDGAQGTDGELAGAPDTTPPAPGQYAAESGQDSGSMA